jgi:hypothetical protein
MNPMPSVRPAMDKSSPGEMDPREVPIWDLEPLKAVLGPVLPVPWRNLPGGEVM